MRMKLGNGLLIAGLFLFCIGCHREVEPYRNGALKKDTDTGVSDVVETEEADEVEEEQEERQPSPEPVQENANSGYYEAHPVT